MNHSVSPLWAIETTTTEKEAATGEPRSLWDRVEAHLRPQEVREYVRTCIIRVRIPLTAVSKDIMLW